MGREKEFDDMEGLEARRMRLKFEEFGYPQDVQQSIDEEERRRRKKDEIDNDDRSLGAKIIGGSKMKREFE